jgi:hypothetical protein
MNELARKEKCVLMRSDIEKWIEWEKAEQLELILQGLTSHKFIKIEGETVNTADIEGVYKPESLEEMKRRKNGEFKCKYNKWHSRQTKCGCAEEEALERAAKATDELLKDRPRPSYPVEPQS